MILVFVDKAACPLGTNINKKEDGELLPSFTPFNYRNHYTEVKILVCEIASIDMPAATKVSTV
jgi:hypothetical protein